MYGMLASVSFESHASAHLSQDTEYSPSQSTSWPPHPGQMPAAWDFFTSTCPDNSMSSSTFPPEHSLHLYLFLEPPHLSSSPPPHSLTPQVRQVSCWLQGEGFEGLGYNALCGEKG